MAQIHIASNNRENIVAGKLSAKYSVDGTRVLRYYIDFRHKILNLHKELSAPEVFILQNKVDALCSTWDEKYANHKVKSAVLSGKSAADSLTIDAAAVLDSLPNILKYTLKVDDRIDWEGLKDFAPYQGQKAFPEAPPQRQRDPQPVYSEPKVGLLDTIFGKSAKIKSDATSSFLNATENWQASDNRYEADYQKANTAWHRRKALFHERYEAEKQIYLDEQLANNAKVDALAKAVSLGETQAVIEHASLVLEKSEYHDLFDKAYEVDYSSEQKTLLVEYSLPSLDKMPKVKSVKFHPATGELKESYISEKENKMNFDSVCYQICLRTIHEVIEADEHSNIEKVLFNGYSENIDKTIGRSARSCIMSVLVDRKDFEEIDLNLVDPKACFKKLKGVSASTLSALAPIAPVMEMDRRDKRFVEARDTVDSMASDTNLAAMNWDDFEHLVRELFEKEFAERGGEVRVTQASRDGGVDAIAFDPDPITGGKIVIQAKRFTHTVTVSAVRDLYGTMIAEGASRGILVTTADFGPDSYSFANGKPITLMSGSNLLHLLARHGYKMKIDIKEARKELNLRGADA